VTLMHRHQSQDSAKGVNLMVHTKGVNRMVHIKGRRNADARFREFPRLRRDLKTIPEASETKEESKRLRKLEKQMFHWKRKADQAGETHWRRGK
jgi:hypothetical protein